MTQVLFNTLNTATRNIFTRRGYLTSCCRFKTTQNVLRNSLGGSVYLKRYYLTIPPHLKVNQFKNRIALVDENGRYQYGHLLNLSNALAEKIAEFDVQRRNVAFLCENDASYVVTMWAIWMNLGCAVPLSKLHPRSELEYFITHSEAKLVIATEEFSKSLEPITQKLNIDLIQLGEKDYSILSKKTSKDASSKQDIKQSDASIKRDEEVKKLVQSDGFKSLPALMVYTSGTTGKPKGVVHTFSSLQAQMLDMIEAWQWTEQDVILHALPLHHVHGIVNALMTPLYIGAACVMMKKFDPKQVWSNLTYPVYGPLGRTINIFMAVPTMYAKLIQYYEHKCDNKEWKTLSRNFIRAVCKNNFRIMVSGSAPLPETFMERWEEITSIKLLERYGMTEIGMGLTNPLHADRIPGAVGKPFPGVEARIVKADSLSKTDSEVLVKCSSKATYIDPKSMSREGELEVRGPSLFTDYYNNPDATEESFTSDGWFKTGDTAAFENGVFRILGRSSVDIIKSGGYKIGALDVERHLMTHENISDVAVVGISDITWGQKVAAVVVLKDQSKDLTVTDLREWGIDLLAPYQLPSELEILEALPRNAMGKVDKKDLVRNVFGEGVTNV